MTADVAAAPAAPGPTGTTGAPGPGTTNRLAATAPDVDLSSLPGVDPRWSRTVTHPCSDGLPRTWHLLDNAVDLAGRRPAGTLLAVHGNPTWSYLWRHVLAAASRPGPGRRPWRVVAVDQLGMGRSDRTPPPGGGPWRLAARVRDLGLLTEALRTSPAEGWPPLDGPVVLLGHDWGGVVASGWAVDHPDDVAALVLTNTAVHAPADDALPIALRAATARGLQAAATRGTSAFLDVTLSLARPALPADVRAAYRAPYRTARHRAAVAGFVEDIPWRSGDPSRPELDRIAEGVRGLGHRGLPALLLWGPDDPVFSDRYLRDLRDRLPQADVHRFEGAGHLVAEDADVAGTLLRWLGGVPGLDADGHPPSTARTPDAGAASHRSLWSELEERRDDSSPAVVQMPQDPDATPLVLGWDELGSRVAEVAAGLHELGVRAGHRVSLLVPPGTDLTTALYACLRLGAVVVVADQGLGVLGLHRAVRGAGPQHVIGVERGLLAARVLGWPGQRVGAGPLRPALRRALGVRWSLPEVAALGRRTRARAGGRLDLADLDLPVPDPDADTAVLFTSGSTGPAKGAVYTGRQLAAMRDAVASAYSVDRSTALVAAFAPFALLGPALGAVSASPAMDVTAPATLTAGAMARAAAAVRATTVFASPAALVNVVATADDLSTDERAALADVRLLLSAGAPVPASLLRAVSRVVPAAELHTPYGMTEVLPVTDVTLEEVEAVGPGDGILVGRPLAGVQVAVSAGAVDDGPPPGDERAPTTSAGVVGELLVRAAHVKGRYDQLWATEDASRVHDGATSGGGVDGGLRPWHRTGDVGHLDADGRVWVQGRTAHLVRTATGVVTPVGVELAAADVDGVHRAAAVGVGPAGTQVLVVVVETSPPARRSGLAGEGLLRDVRVAVAATGAPEVAAVLVVPSLPTDVRHDSKVDRTAVAAWAGRALAGERVAPPWTSPRSLAAALRGRRR